MGIKSRNAANAEEAPGERARHEAEVWCNASLRNTKEKADAMNDMNRLINEHIERAVRNAVIERFGKDVTGVEIKERRDMEGEVQLLVEVQFSAETAPQTVSSGFFGLTGLVRKAMGADMESVFPVIRPVIRPVAHA